MYQIINVPLDVLSPAAVQAVVDDLTAALALRDEDVKYWQKDALRARLDADNCISERDSALAERDCYVALHGKAVAERDRLRAGLMDSPKITAIKAVRQLTGCGIAEAKAAVEQLLAGLTPPTAPA